mmetsp:Transcript_44873/g.103812  ORF Transcript_44873/g.103812 Transcript_44873/m.103812 type:complete len:268 (+) Transcript_44873:35-838(+)
MAVEFLYTFFSCQCRHRARSPRAQGSYDEAKPVLTTDDSAASVSETASAASAQAKPAERPAEARICPITGAIGYCPMARPPKGSKLPDVLPELKVMLFLLWEDGLSKVSIGVYPHMNKHWEALELPDTASREQIKEQFRKLSLKYHPDKCCEPGAAERFTEVKDAFQALKDVDGTLGFPWEEYPERQQVMTGLEVLKTFGKLGAEAAGSDPIKAQMMQHVVKEANDCKVLFYEKVSSEVHETWADGLCVDTRNGSNHLIKVYRRISK